MDRPFGGNAGEQISFLEDGEFARSARTQRPRRRRRLIGGGTRNAVAGKMDLGQYRAESVRHDASPSCRDRSRQGPACSPRTARHERNRPAAMFGPSALAVRWLRPCARRMIFGLQSVSRLGLEGERSTRPRLETFRQKTTAPTSLWVSNRQSLGKASPTCTPPPICTLAPFPKPRWSQDRGRRERPRNTLCAKTRNAFDSPLTHPIPHLR